MFTDNVGFLRGNFSSNWQKAPLHTNASAKKKKKKIISQLATILVFYIVHTPSHANELIANIG